MAKKVKYHLAAKKRQKMATCKEQQVLNYKENWGFVKTGGEIYKSAEVNGNSRHTANCLMDCTGRFAFISDPNASPHI